MDMKRNTDETPIYLNDTSTIQTPEEDRKDKSNDPRKNTTMEPSNDDLRESAADHAAGREPIDTDR